MPVMPLPLHAGDNVEIEFVARSTNVGTTFVHSGYVPDSSGPPAPVVPPVMLVAAGASAVQTTTVTAAFTLIIDVDVPMAGGGDLTVRVNGALRDQGAITGDQDWVYVIV